MSNPTEILPRTSIAAVVWRSPNVPKDFISVFTQDVKGGIRESVYNGQYWSGGSDKDVITDGEGIPKAKLYSPLAVTTVNDGHSIRIYYLTVDNRVQELCFDSAGQRTWYPGQLNGKAFGTSPVSRLAAVGQSKHRYISVYYQTVDGKIGEIKRTAAGWTEGEKFGDKPLVGTGLAAMTTQGAADTGIQVFYQAADGALVQFIFDGSGWVKGDLTGLDMAAAATNIAAFGYGNSQNPMSQLFFLGQTNVPTEVGYYSGKWKPGQNHPGHSLSVPGSDIAVVKIVDPEWPQAANNLKYFIQDDENQIQEYHYRKVWPDWRKSSIIPTGDLQ